MFMQSAAMALAFGSNFQYGKRKISAMSNEDFNKMSALDMNVDLANTINNMIPSVEQSFRHMEKMNITILDSMARYFGQAISYGLDVLTGKKAVETGGEEHFDVSHIIPNLLGIEGHGTPEEIIGSNAQSVAATASNEQFNNPPTITLNAYEQWASRWINYRNNTANFSNAKFEELRYMLNQISAGKGGQTTKWRSSILKEWTAKSPRVLTPTEQAHANVKAIEASSTGQTKRIALLYQDMRTFLAKWKKKPSDKTNQRNFFEQMKFYNKYVQSIRKANLTVDTAKSLSQMKIIPK